MFMGSWLNGDCEAEDAAVKGKINVIKTWLWAGYLKKMVKKQVLQRQMDSLDILCCSTFFKRFSGTLLENIHKFPQISYKIVTGLTSRIGWQCFRFSGWYF